MNLNQVLLDFKNTYMKKQITKMMMYSFHKTRMINNFIKFMSHNKNNFNDL